jgi:photosystem II stability/assembly factor-like uncharacterized protein
MKNTPASCFLLYKAQTGLYTIYMSTDTGRTWRPVGAAGKRVFDLAQHPTNPKYMVAACDSGSVFFSGSWGYGWEEYSHGLPEDISVRVVAIADWGGDDAEGGQCHRSAGQKTGRRVYINLKVFSGLIKLVGNLRPWSEYACLGEKKAPFLRK